MAVPLSRAATPSKEMLEALKTTYLVAGLITLKAS
jgi:hypothetical protein